MQTIRTMLHTVQTNEPTPKPPALSWHFCTQI